MPSASIESNDASAIDKEPVAVQGAQAALILLVCINVFNYIDRQVLAAVEPNIRAEFFPGQLNPETGEVEEPKDAKFWMGLLPSAFLVLYMFASPVFGWLSNRTSRWLLIGIGVIAWSLASGASGLATTFAILLLTRCAVGIGEAVYGPVAPDMLSDLYPIKQRGSVIALFYTAIPFGGALGFAVGDSVWRLTGSWRMAFYVVVPPGLLLGLICWFMREPRRGISDPGAKIDRSENWSDYLVLLRTPSYVLNILGMTAMTFAMGGLAYWVPAYLQERGVQDLAIGPLQLSPQITFGAMTALVGLASTILGGICGDRLRSRLPGSYFLVSGAAMVLAFPMLILMTVLPFPVAWIPLSLFVFGLFFNTGPTNTVIANVTHPLLRAPAYALCILVIHLLGDVVSPPLMGLIAGWSSLDVAFRFVSLTVLLGGILWLWGARHLERDTALAPTSLSS